MLEALAAGLPALYVTCPPLDELAPTAAPPRAALPADAASLRDALRAELARLAERRRPGSGARRRRPLRHRPRWPPPSASCTAAGPPDRTVPAYSLIESEGS